MSRLYEAMRKSGREEAHRSFLQVAVEDLPLALQADAEHNRSGLDSVPLLTLPDVAGIPWIVAFDKHSAGAEKMRSLATRLRQLQQRQKLRQLLITSSINGEGKSVVAVNVAIALAQQGRQRVLLIDGDTRQPALSAMLDLANSPGLCDAWSNNTSVTSFLRRCDGLPLWVLPAGCSIEAPVTMLQSDVLPAMISPLAPYFEWMIIDSPPATAIADGNVWATMCDGILLVTCAGRTPLKILGKVTASLDKSKLLGTVLNHCVAGRQLYYEISTVIFSPLPVRPLARTEPLPRR